MSDINSQIAVLENQMKNISDKVDEGFKQNSIEHKEVVAMFNQAMEKKASKWVEQAIIGVVIFILTAVGGALLALVLK